MFFYLFGLLYVTRR